ncbi:MAG TPA: T9SS type A sorting domain-containing protein [Flavobacteriales bacterium]|nr:T9SS type A sorting domain-containing protein [Flavobacteriales bacterium]
MPFQGCHECNFGHKHIVRLFTSNQNITKMKTTTSIFLIIVISSRMLSAQSIGFEKTYGDQLSNQTGFSVQQTADNGYIMVGGNDIFKTDPYGNLEWSKLFVGDGKWVEEINNAYIFCGSRGGNVYVEKRDLSGSLLWNASYGTAATDNYGCSIRETYDGDLIITGYIDSLNGVKGMCLIKTDSAGNMLWENVYENDYDERGYSIQVTSDSGYIITGHAEWSNVELTTIFKINSTGDVQWEIQFPGSCRDIIQTTDGGYMAIGDKPQIFGIYNDIYILKLNTAGQTQWDALLEETYALDEAGNAVVQTQDGGYVISGTQREQQGQTTNFYSQAFLLKVDSLGNFVWHKFFGNTQLSSTYGYDVGLCNDSGFALLGSQKDTNASTFDFYLVKTNHLGILDTSVLVLQFSTYTNPSCYGLCDGQATVNASGGTAPYTYNWSNGTTTSSASQLCASLYAVTVTDATGSDPSSTITLYDPPPLNISATGTDESFCGANDGSITVLVSGGTPFCQYSIDCVSFDTSNTFTGLSAGTYTICAMDTFGCQEMMTHIIDCPAASGIKGNVSDLKIKASPNPALDKLHINLGNCYNEVALNMFSTTGMKVFSIGYSNQHHLYLDLKDLAPGVYLVQIQTSDNIKVLRVVKGN